MKAAQLFLTQRTSKANRARHASKFCGCMQKQK